MARRKDPRTGKLLPEGITPAVSPRSGEVSYRARLSYGPSGYRQHLGKTFRTAEAAIAWRLERLAEINLGTIIDPATTTCDQFFAAWRRISPMAGLA